MKPEIDYEAPAVLHERVAAGPMISGVQMFRGGPIAEGTLVSMIKRGMAMPLERAVNTTITVDAGAVGEETWLEYDQYRQLSERNDFPN